MGDTSAEPSIGRQRRGLRVWPISKEGSLRDRVVEFFVNELLLDQQYAADLTFAARRTRNPRAGTATTGSSQALTVKDEVLVTFDSVRDRDDVRLHAKNLERRGRGVRLEIPDHLWPSFRTVG